MEVAFLFDNDGVLIDSTALHWASWEKLMEEEGDGLQIDKKEFTSKFGKTNSLILKEIAPDVPEATRKRWGDRKEAIYRELAQKGIPLIPGIIPFLEEIEQAGIPHIIASSTPLANLQLILSTTKLGEFFEHYLSAEDVGEGKPAPDVFLSAAKELGYFPSQCIVVEDAPAGILAAQRAGCFIVALTTTHKKEELQGAHLIYAGATLLNLPEILAAFRKWAKDLLV